MNFSVMLFLFSCVLDDCEDIYTPEMPENVGVDSLTDESSSFLKCPGGIELKDAPGDTFYVYICDENCNYDNGKVYCVSVEHIEMFSQESCCRLSYSNKITYFQAYLTCR